MTILHYALHVSDIKLDGLYHEGIHAENLIKEKILMDDIDITNLPNMGFKNRFFIFALDMKSLQKFAAKLEKINENS